MKRYFSALLMLVILCSLAITGRAKIMDKTDIKNDEAGADIPAVAPGKFQPIRASVTNPDPSQFTIDVKKLANMGANEDAPVFAVYTSASLPEKCGDYRDLELNYRKPTKYERVFDLRNHPEVLEAIDKYGCVAMRNIPSK